MICNRRRTVKEESGGENKKTENYKEKWGKARRKEERSWRGGERGKLFWGAKQTHCGKKKNYIK